MSIFCSTPTSLFLNYENAIALFTLRIMASIEGFIVLRQVKQINVFALRQDQKNFNLAFVQISLYRTLKHTPMDIIFRVN